MSKPTYDELAKHLRYVAMILGDLIRPRSNTRHEEAKHMAAGTLDEAEEVLTRLVKSGHSWKE